MIESLIALRRELHQYPELSGLESGTAERIQHFIAENHPCQIVKNIGGQSFAAVYSFSEHGPTIGIRCELDALPIHEENDFEYQSQSPGVSHKCGHDGHMAIVCGLIFWIKKQNFQQGKIVLLFQSAEETGVGAHEMIKDQSFKDLKFDYIFALHNIPGASLHSVLLCPTMFSAEVQSFSIVLKGKESHASEPEKGNNPVYAINEISSSIDSLNQHDPAQTDFAIITPVFIQMGQKSYGISPANGELHYTLRTWEAEKMSGLKKEIEAITESICTKHKLEFVIDWFEYFPGVKNDLACNNAISKAARSKGLTLVQQSYPFRFGEDFGWFSKEYKTAMFGLGAGIETPALHYANYDFPDELISTGIDVFAAIISNILSELNK